jgi:hypothetical protein
MPACCQPLCLHAANIPACCLHACLLPICLPPASMFAYCQYACLLPLCLPTANTPTCCLYACLLPIRLPAAAMLAYCQYACLLPLWLPTANTPACCLYACLLPIRLPIASMLAYCQYACLLPLCLPTANMPACPYVYRYIYKSIAQPPAMESNLLLRLFVCQHVYICLLVCTFNQRISMSLCLSLWRSLQSSKENIQHFKTWNFLTFFYVCGLLLPSGILIRIRNPDPQIWLNPDPIQIRNTGTKCTCLFVCVFFYLPILSQPVYCVCISISICSHLGLTGNQCWGSVTFWCGSGSGSPDPYLWLMDPDPDPDTDPIPDPTPFFNDFKDVKK